MGGDRRIKMLVSVMLAVVMFSGCSMLGRAPRLSNPSFRRTERPLDLPKLAGPMVYEVKLSNCVAGVDTNYASDGYIVAKVEAQQNAVLILSNGSMRYPYYVKGDGKSRSFPLTMGPGEYNFELYLNIEGQTYMNILSGNVMAEIDDERTPFLRPNIYVEYTEDEKVVDLAHSLAQNASNDLEIVQQVYYWVQTNIDYDYDKADRLRSATLESSPDFRQLLEDRKGICFDYASLVAALLRINNVPCKVVFGWVTTEKGETELHAWNMVWLDSEGKIARNVMATPGGWSRLDLTFAARGEAGIRILDEDSRYTPLSEH